MPDLIKSKQDLEKFVLDRLKKPRTNQIKDTLKRLTERKAPEK